MNKTSVYLSDDEKERLAHLARIEGKSQADIIRAAIRQYRCEAQEGKRRFSFVGSASVPGLSARELAQLPDEDLFEGLGE